MQSINYKISLKNGKVYEKFVIIDVSVWQYNRDFIHFFLSVSKTISAKLVEIRRFGFGDVFLFVSDAFVSV